MHMKIMMLFSVVLLKNRLLYSLNPSQNEYPQSMFQLMYKVSLLSKPEFTIHTVQTYVSVGSNRIGR